MLDADKPRENFHGLLVTDPSLVVEDPRVDVVLELMGGLEPARTLILKALSLGKHVVTANKAVLAEHGLELFAAARKHNRFLAFVAILCVSASCFLRSLSKLGGGAGFAPALLGYEPDYLTACPSCD